MGRFNLRQQMANSARRELGKPEIATTNELGEKIFADYALPGQVTVRSIIRDINHAARQSGQTEAVLLTTWCASSNVDLGSAVNGWGQARRLRGDPFPGFYHDLGIENEGAARDLWGRATEIGMRPASAFAAVISWTETTGDADDAVKIVAVYVLAKRCTITQTPLEPELAAMAQAGGEPTDGLWLLLSMAFALTEDGLLDRLRDHATQTGTPIANILVMIEERSVAAKLTPAEYSETLLKEAAETARKAEALRNFGAAGTAQREEAKAVSAADLEDAISELNSLIGLSEAKQSIRRFMAVMEVNKARGSSTAPAMNIVFVGGAGTGKTTLARLLGRLLAGAGLLTSGHVVETDPGGMKGAYLGQTAPKVTALFDAAKGGILFCDEVYGLSDNQQDAFGKEATDVLLKLAEDRRGQLAVVIAGYSAETQRFLDSNPGLQSRFNTVVRFADYTPTEMLQVLHVMAGKQGFSLAAGCDEILNGYFARRPQGNGRLCRNVLEAASQEAALRLQPRLAEATPDELATITLADLKAALQRLS